jgi:hypothetical protein
MPGMRDGIFHRMRRLHEKSFKKRLIMRRLLTIFMRRVVE